jgi:hypothetical protein
MPFSYMNERKNLRGSVAGRAGIRVCPYSSLDLSFQKLINDSIATISNSIARLKGGSFRIKNKNYIIVAIFPISFYYNLFRISLNHTNLSLCVKRIHVNPY